MEIHKIMNVIYDKMPIKGLKNSSFGFVLKKANI